MECFVEFIDCFNEDAKKKNENALNVHPEVFGVEITD